MPCSEASLCMAKRCKIELKMARVEAHRSLKTKPNLYKAPSPEELLLKRGFQPRTYSPARKYTVYTQVHTDHCPHVFSEFLKQKATCCMLGNLKQAQPKVNKGGGWEALDFLAAYVWHDPLMHRKKKSVKNLVHTKRRLIFLTLTRTFYLLNLLTWAVMTSEEKELVTLLFLSALL